MHITIKRQPSQKGATLSAWTVSAEGVNPAPAIFCYGVEDIVRAPGVYVFGKTAIPPGTYAVPITFSNRFQRPLPLITDLPGRRTLFGGRPIGDCGIRIHPGNTAADTEGCLLPGSTLGPDGASVQGSRVAFDRLFTLIQKAVAAHEPVTLTIS